jgi:serine/threonine-protein kinase
MAGPGAVFAQRYRLDERIGGGAMGEVWRGTDLALDRTVAVKLVRPELLAEASFRDRFLAEARTMARIRHPGVVAVHDYYGDPDLAFLVMEHVAGESLARRLHRSGPLPPEYAMTLLAQAGEALQAAHDTGVVHRDVKPGNLLVTPQDTVVLTDFGIARSVASAPLTATGALIGTVAYLAPEQVLGKPATPRSDVYALGVVGYECLTGHRPFDGDNPFEVAMKRVQLPPPELPGELPAQVRAVVDRALAADPEQRWASAAELAGAARRAAAGPEPAGPPAPPAFPAPPPFPAPAVPPAPAPAYSAPAYSAPAYSPPEYSPPAYAAPPYPVSPGPPPGPPAGYPPPAYPGSGYQAPPGPGAVPQSQNVLGLLGMIFGIVAIAFAFCCVLLAVPLGGAGIVLGGLGMKKAADGLASNRGMALAGVICGAVGVLLSIVLLAFNVVGGFAGYP